MSSIELTGIHIASPIGFMAALGLLRVCAQDHGQAVGLSWGSGHARLSGISQGQLIELMAMHMRDRSHAPEFNLEVQGKDGRRVLAAHLSEIPPADYRATAQAWRHDLRALGFLAGFGTDAFVNDKGHVARTGFDFSSGQQRLAQTFRQLAQKLDTAKPRTQDLHRERLLRALTGGPYEPQHSCGWDPLTRQSHALQADAPTNSVPLGQPFLVWLAIESLPLHPVVPVPARRPVTTGFVGSTAYAWPQWEEPLDLAEVRLLRQRALNTLNDLTGVTAVWASGITASGKFRSFLPAARTTSDHLTPRRFARTDLPD